MRIDPATIKSRLTIGAVLRAHGHTPRAGRMPCPLHGGDNRSAFSIKPGDQYARCWACGWAGDVIALEHALGGGTVAEAMRRCAELAGIRQPREWERKPWLERQQRQREAIQRHRERLVTDWRNTHVRILRDELAQAWHERRWATEHLARHPEEPALWAWLGVACEAFDRAEWAVDRGAWERTLAACGEVSGDAQ